MYLEGCHRCIVGSEWLACAAHAVSRELPVEEENIQTQLHRWSSEEHYTYVNVPWKLYLRKEVRGHNHYRPHPHRIHLSSYHQATPP